MAVYVSANDGYVETEDQFVCLKYLFCSPKTWLETSQGLLQNTLWFTLPNVETQP